MGRVQSVKLSFHNQTIERKAFYNSSGGWGSAEFRTKEILLYDTCVYCGPSLCAYVAMCPVVPITCHKQKHFLF